MGLNANAPMCIFGFKYITCLDYIITRYGIKPYMNKVQGIMDLSRTTTTSEAKVLIGMVQ